MFILPFGRCIIPVSLILSSIPVYGYDKVYMGHETKSGYMTCPQKINSNGGEISGLVRPYETALDCTVKIEAELGSMIKIKIDEINFVTADPGGCYSVKLLIYDGEFFENSNIIPSFPNGLCNQTFPSQTLRTRSNMLSLRFEVIGTLIDVSFQVIYTSYTKVNDGSCFFCGDTEEMCIPDELRCDGLENCANSFDEEDCLPIVNGDPGGGSSATWIAIFATIGVILFVAFIVFLLVYKRHASSAQNTNASRAEEQVYNNDSIYYGPSTSQSTQPPPPVTSSPPSNEQSVSYAHDSAAGLPDQPPSYERSLQDAAAEELALKRSLAQD